MLIIILWPMLLRNIVLTSKEQQTIVGLYFTWQHQSAHYNSNEKNVLILKFVFSATQRIVQYECEQCLSSSFNVTLLIEKWLMMPMRWRCVSQSCAFYYSAFTNLNNIRKTCGWMRLKLTIDKSVSHFHKICIFIWLPLFALQSGPT